jgi:hypothetical protein
VLSFFKEPPYGRELAEGVAALLDRGEWIGDSHAYYCGTGFAMVDGKYCWAHIDDGFPGKVLQAFSSRGDFVDWLAAQTDASFEAWSGEGPVQIPGRKRLEHDVRNGGFRYMR